MAEREQTPEQLPDNSPTSSNRRQIIVSRGLKLAGIALSCVIVFFAARLITLVWQLQYNWDVGYDFVKQLDSLASQVDSGIARPLLAIPIPVPPHLPFIACIAGVCLVVTSALLAVNPPRKFGWIVFIITPLWLCGSLSWQAIGGISFKTDSMRMVHLTEIIRAVETARQKDVLDALIAANLRESRRVFKWTYEEPGPGFQSMQMTQNAIKKLPERVKIQAAKELLKKTMCVFGWRVGFSGRTRPEAKAARLLYHDALKNGVADVLRLYQTAETNEGRIYALAILYRTDREAFDSNNLGYSPGPVTLMDYCFKMKETARDIHENPIRFEHPPFDKLFPPKEPE